MDLNLTVFQEPRGVMRILHFIFSICAFATITGYNGFVKSACPGADIDTQAFSYPFEIIIQRNISNNPKPVTSTPPPAPTPAPAQIICSVSIVGDFSSDAKFFVTTGVLAMLYALAIIFVYIKMDRMYKSDTKIPLIDFMATVLFAVLWLSSSAAWANGLTGLKTETSPILNKETCNGCYTSTSNFSTLNISVIFGFLNFFLWAADLWFVYKETSWFQGNQRQDTEGV